MGEEDDTHRFGDPRSERERVEQAYARYARTRARAWGVGRAGNRAILAELERALDETTAEALAADGPIVDLGCGTGRWLGHLAGRGVAPERLLGVEIQPARVAMAQRALPEARIVEGDVRDTGLPGGEASLVLLMCVLSSLQGGADVERALAEARRLLAPGGTLVIYELRRPSVLNPSSRLLRDAELDAAGIHPREERPITLLPPLARALGPLAPRAYPLLARWRVLRSHRLIRWRAASTASSSVA